MSIDGTHDALLSPLVSAAELCPSCNHDNTDVELPDFSQLRAHLGIDQSRPKCVRPLGEDATVCGCKDPAHAQI